MKFQMTHRFLGGDLQEFDELTAPDWLTSRDTIRGSSMDNRWFWEDHVLTLPLGGSVETDFQTIKRIV